MKIFVLGCGCVKENMDTIRNTLWKVAPKAGIDFGKNLKNFDRRECDIIIHACDTIKLSSLNGIEKLRKEGVFILCSSAPEYEVWCWEHPLRENEYDEFIPRFREMVKLIKRIENRIRRQ